MGKIEEAIALAKEMAADQAHGYDQAKRWGPDYDCSSFLIHVWESVGVPLKSNGATYTGNMRAAALRSGFEDVTDQILDMRMGAGIQTGDIVLNTRNHVAMYIGGGQLIQASINERGGITGGQTGDQTGAEIGIVGWYYYSDGGWDAVLRYTGAVQTKADQPVETLPTVRRGMMGSAVLSLQVLLIYKWGLSCGPAGADGEFGVGTEKAVETFQGFKRLEADKICGPKTWAALIG